LLLFPLVDPIRADTRAPDIEKWPTG
jgi:hypothetical protein